METVKNNPILFYTEQTPNPETLKFVSNRMLYKGVAEFKDKEFASEWSPLASDLFTLPYVKGIYICNNFVTITKELTFSWDDIMLETKNFLKSYLEEDKEVVKEGFAEAMEKLEEARGASYNYSEDEAEIVKKIKDLIETYVKPAVEMDGGNIEFDSWNAGVVKVVMQGACSGCPSSTVTLKSGIEGMLKRMIPEVKEVVSIAG